LAQLTWRMDPWYGTLRMVCDHSRHNAHEGTPTPHRPHGHQPMHQLRPNRYATSSRDGLWRRKTNLELGPKSPRKDTQYTPPAHPWRLDSSPSISHEAPATTRTILWILAHLVYYRTQYHNHTTLQDYSDFLRRARWKAHSKDQRRKRVGDYLHMIYMACIRTATPDTMKLRLDPQILSRSPICNCDRTTQNYTFLHPLLHTWNDTSMTLWYNVTILY
jgi:hypothetical protein